MSIREMENLKIGSETYEVADKKAREYINKNRLVEYIFNPQNKINDSNYVLVTATTPTEGTTYYTKNEDGTYSPFDFLETFKAGVNYYVKSDDYNDITGECFIIKAYGKVIMLDTGGTNRYDSIKQHLQDNGITKIDYLIISHYHYDHCSNINNLVKDFDFSNCKCYLPLLSGAPDEGEPLEKANFDNCINSLGLTKVYPNEGEKLTIGDLEITFYNCGEVAFNELDRLYATGETKKTNDYSMLCLFKNLDTNVLFAADIEKVGQTRLLNKGYFKDIKINLYKWHHHGLNSLENYCEGYLEMIAPLDFVIVNFSHAESFRDTVLLNSNKNHYANDKERVFVSNGMTVEQINKNERKLEIKNRQIYGNADTLNNYFGFMKIKCNSNWKTQYYLFELSDCQHFSFDTVFSVSVRSSVSKTPSLVEITKVYSNRYYEILDDLYIGTVEDGVILYLKKGANEKSPIISLLNYTGQDSTEYEAIREELTQEEFTAKYGENYYKYKYWNEIALESQFENHNENEKPLHYRRVGNVVEIKGAIKPTAEIAQYGQAIIAKLPPELAPVGPVYTIQQGSGANTWLSILYGRS